MHPRRRRLEGSPARSRILASAMSLVALVGAAACGGSNPSPAPASGSAAVPAAAASSGAQASVAQASPGAIAGGDWAGFRGDASRMAIGVAGPTGHPVLNWQFKAGGGVPNNIAIVGDAVYFASDDAVVHAVSRTSGKELWTSRLEKPTVRGPLAVDGRLYFADEAGAVFALDPGKAGSKVWQSTAAYPDTTEMLSVDGGLYFGTGDGFLVALDAATGAERWKLQLTPNGAPAHNPAYADGRIFLGTAGAGFKAVDLATHAVVWTGDLGGDDTGTASAGNGAAYIATPADSTAGKLRAFDAATGKPLWTGPSPMLTTPNVVHGIAYSSSMQGLVDAIDASTGALRWSVQLSGKIRPMAVVGTTLYLSADTEQRVYAIDTTSGKKLWQFDVDGGSDCCIAVAGGAVFVGTLKGSVYSIGGDGQQIAAVPFGSAAPAPSAGVAVAAQVQVNVTWTTDLRGMGFSPISQIAVDPRGRIWAPEGTGDKIAIIGADGKRVEEIAASGNGPGQFDFTRTNGDAYGTLAFAKDGSYFVLDVGNRRVQHFDEKRRFINDWGGFGTGPGQFSDPVGIAVAGDGTVWVQDNGRGVTEHYRPDGSVIGSFDPFANQPGNDGANSLAIDSKGNLYLSMAAPSKIAIFNAKGAFLRFVGDGAFSEQATHMAIDGSGRIFVTQGPDRGSAPGVLVFAPDGTEIGGFGPEGVGDGQLVFPAGVALDGKGGLYVEDSEPDSARLVRFSLPADLT